jgi:hypothetical protein
MVKKSADTKKPLEESGSKDIPAIEEVDSKEELIDTTAKEPKDTSTIPEKHQPKLLREPLPLKTSVFSEPMPHHSQSNASSFFKIILAIIAIGLILLAGLYFFAPQLLNVQAPNLISTLPFTQEPVSLSLDLSSPDDNALVNSPDLLIQGKSSPGATVLLTAADGDHVLDNSGDTFSYTLTLTEGPNIIYISAFDELGNRKVEKRSVYYSKEKL